MKKKPKISLSKTLSSDNHLVERLEKPCKPLENELIRTPKHHHYPTQVIVWSLLLLIQVYTSLRGANKTLALFAPFLGFQTPSYSVISNWSYRLGVYLLHQPISYRDDWIIVLDETIQLSKNKALVILGIPREKLEQIGYAPRHQDMELIDIHVLTHSDGEIIHEILEKLSLKIGTLLQIVSDHGSDIKKGVDLYQQSHTKTICTHDISHYVALVLKKQLANDERWTSFLSHCGQTCSQIQQTELAFLKPPKQRTKARFMHTGTHLKWGNKLLNYYKKGDFSDINPIHSVNWDVHDAIEETLGRSVVTKLVAIHGKPFKNRHVFKQALIEQLGQHEVNLLDDSIFQKADFGWRRWNEKLGWLLDYEEDLDLFSAMVERTRLVQVQLKKKGLAKGAKAETQQAFQQLSPHESPRVKEVEIAIIDYLGNAEKNITEETPPLLASSDIIESVFGKYKFLTRNSPLKEVGKRLLLIPVFLTQLSTDLVQEAMEKVRNSDVDQWAKEACGISMLAKCRQAFKITGNSKT
jgi:hypothetical protein